MQIVHIDMICFDQTPHTQKNVHVNASRLYCVVYVDKGTYIQPYIPHWGKGLQDFISVNVNTDNVRVSDTNDLKALKPVADCAYVVFCVCSSDTKDRTVKDF